MNQDSIHLCKCVLWLCGLQPVRSLWNIFESGKGNSGNFMYFNSCITQLLCYLTLYFCSKKAWCIENCESNFPYAFRSFPCCAMLVFILRHVFVTFLICQRPVSCTWTYRLILISWDLCPLFWHMFSSYKHHKWNRMCTLTIAPAARNFLSFLSAVTRLSTNPVRSCLPASAFLSHEISQQSSCVWVQLSWNLSMSHSSGVLNPLFICRREYTSSRMREILEAFLEKPSSLSFPRNR